MSAPGRDRSITKAVGAKMSSGSICAVVETPWSRFVTLCSARGGSACLSDAINGVAALGAFLAGPDLPDSLGSLDRNALAPFQPGKEASDSVGLPAGRLDDLGNGGAFRPAQHGEHLLLLGALARLADA